MSDTTKNAVQALIAFWLLGVIIGGIWGTYRSPNCKDKQEIETYINDHYKTATGVRSAGGNDTFGFGTLYVKSVYLECGTRTYSYSYFDDSAKVTTGPNPNFTAAAGSSRKTEFTLASFTAIATALKLVGVEMPSIAASSEILKQGNKVVVLVAVAGGVLGVGVGYYLTYADNCNCSDDAFQKALMDVDLWKTFHYQATQQIQRGLIGSGQ